MTWPEAMIAAQKLYEDNRDASDEDGGPIDPASMHGCALFCGRYETVGAMPPDHVCGSGDGGIVFRWFRDGAELSAEIECPHHICWIRSGREPNDVQLWISFIDLTVDDRAKPFLFAVA